jgi:GNAT superfamily N-acetyltransferase
LNAERSPLVLVDADLAAKLERTEGLANARFVEARATVDPQSAATWIQVAGALVSFDGAESPCTQAFGLGMFGEVTQADFETIETFYRERHAPVVLEICPLASADLLPLLNARNYRPIEYTNVLCQRIGPHILLPNSPNLELEVRKANNPEQWAQTSARGWSESPEFFELILGFGRTFASTVGSTGMQAELGGKPIATGVVFVADQVALLAGASTIPEARKQGAQSALLAARLHYAVEQGCELAMMCAAPGSPSQRNAQRHGYQIAYTRTKWKLEE